MPRPPLPPPRGAPAVRTYLVLAVAGAAGAAAFVRPLGTVVAPRRELAREAARALYPHVASEELRVVAASGVSSRLLIAALAADGELALRAG